MKIQKVSYNKKLILTIIAIVIVTAMAVVVYVYVSSNNRSTETSDSTRKEVDLNPATDEQIQSGKDTKQQSIDDAADQTNPSNTQSLPVTITAANQNGSTVSIRGLISDIVSQDGSCTLIVTNGSRLITKTASTQALNSSSTCKGFDIAVGELGSGTWKIELKVTIGNQSGSTSTSVDII